MARLKAPEGTTSVSVGGKELLLDGLEVTVDDVAIITMLSDFGFTEVEPQEVAAPARKAKK